MSYMSTPYEYYLICDYLFIADWNIMTSCTMKHIASRVPTTIGELSMCDVPQNILRQFGERIVRTINSFITQENLQQYIQFRLGYSTENFVDMSNDSDKEFADDIDYLSIVLPESDSSGQTIVLD